MTEHEANTVKIDFDSITLVEEVDRWLDKLSKILNGYIVRNNKDIKINLTLRLETRTWKLVDRLLDKRLELATN